MFSTGFTSFIVLLFFFIDHLFCLCKFFDSVSSNIDEVLLINPSANVFCLWKLLTSIKRAHLPILVELIDMVNSAIIFKGLYSYD